MKKIILIITIFITVGCSLNENDINAEFIKFLNTDFNNQFEILESETSYAIGDDLTTLELRFTTAGHKKLLSQLKLNNAKTINGFSYSKDIKHESGIGHDFFLLHANESSLLVSVQYGHE